MLLGISFPPSPFFSLAFVAFIPILLVADETTSYWKFTIRLYIFLFVFHLLTIYWTGGFATGNDVWMMTAGVAVVVLHPVFFLPLLLLAFFIKRKLGQTAWYFSFALLWVSFEYLHSHTEYSFPWLTIGNSQAYNLSGIQIIEFVSIYGLSLLILIFNIVAYILLKNLSSSKWNMTSRQTLATVAILLLIYFAPKTYGSIQMHRYAVDGGAKLRVGVVQPNIDPWEKWGDKSFNPWESYDQQFHLLLSESKKLTIDSPDVFIWPETAIPFHILHPKYASYQQQLFSFIDSMKIPVLTGLPTVKYFSATDAPATSEKINDDLYAQSYNSLVLIQEHRNVSPIYKKIELVPFGERLPYPETFRFLVEPLKWNVGISSWGKGNDTLVYSFQTSHEVSATAGAIICYESAYPDFVRAFVKRGAQCLVVITNDSWWGNTSGAYQHASFASLRAVETRRWVVQCANGGVSLIVDPTGVVRYNTKLYTANSFVADIHLQNHTTFYVRYGDVVGKLCVLLSFLLVFAAMIFSVTTKRRGV
jgi:apolipoprotein N-acyltransferase